MSMSKARVTELTVGMRGPPPAMNSAGGWGWNDRPPWEPHHTNWPMQPPPGDMVVSACYSIPQLYMFLLQHFVMDFCD